MSTSYRDKKNSRKDNLEFNTLEQHEKKDKKRRTRIETKKDLC